ncbi:MAG TPA: NAD(P)/FAD-dependent oxidoreductase, partial [Tepidisphaeraceae bacterium]
SYGQTLESGGAVLCQGSVDQTAAALGIDGAAYRNVFGPLVRDWEDLVPMLLAPAGTMPRHPITMARFGLQALQSVHRFTDKHFKTPAARALFAGVAAHAVLPFDFAASSAFGLTLNASAHAAGWPVVCGGSQVLADAMARHFQSLGGKIELNAPVESLAELSGSKAILCDIGPHQLVALAGDRLPAGYAARLKKFRYGPAAFKMDWALSQPVPWKNADLLKAGTVHVGGSYEEMAASERASWDGRHPEKPFLLLVQQTLMDPTRAPQGKHTVWAYAHVPNGDDTNQLDAIENQIERFAPGFRDCILGRSVMRPGDLQRFNANLVGGDVTGGANMLSQVFTRPLTRWNPYSTPIDGLYLCSASTPPGGGVHGMCGYNAAKSALRGVFGIK